MSGLRRRVPTALGYGALVLLAVAVRPTGLVVWALLAALAYLEFARLTGASALAGTLIVLGLWAAHMAAGFVPFLDPAPLLALGLAVLLLEAWRLGAGGPRGSWRRSAGGLRAWPRRAAWTLGGALWIGGLLGYLVDLGVAGATGTTAPRDWPVWLLLALLVTWTADTSAYAVGALWGRRRLIPRLSPGKTWEGTLAGFIAAAAVALLFVPLAGVPLVAALMVAVLAGPAALAGDLAESALKRRAGVKDSGSLLPGHGGIFDRIDSLLAVAPVVALALRVASPAG